MKKNLFTTGGVVFSCCMAAKAVIAGPAFEALSVAAGADAAGLSAVFDGAAPGSAVGVPTEFFGPGNEVAKYRRIGSMSLAGVVEYNYGLNASLENPSPDMPEYDKYLKLRTALGVRTSNYLRWKKAADAANSSSGNSSDSSGSGPGAGSGSPHGSVNWNDGTD